MEHKWYETFFGGMTLDLWRTAMTPEITRREADFLVAVLGLGEAATGEALLDVPCGNGRLCIELARRGFRMTGVDLSAEFIGEARQASGGDDVEVTLRLGDMRDLPWSAEFDGAFCFGNSFGYFDREGNVAFLAAVASSLKPGALFVLDTLMAAESILPNLDDRVWTRVGDCTVLVENEYDPSASRLDTQYTMIRGGVSEVRQAHHWIFTIGDLRGILRQHGLEPTAMVSSLDLEPYHVGATRLILIAQKQ